MELIKLKVKQVAGKGETAKMIVYSFIQACTNLDASILEPLINEDQLFDDLDKYRFLDFLKGQFDYAKELGLKETIMRRGKCQMCVIGHPSYEFYSEDGKIRFAYIIEEKEGEVKNIFNCNASSGWFKK
ncbi:hypothetical protein [Arenibacter palladensis]|uniref:hypothetical protein n=1 Tax=Arenibacter palladensis TaxID=237373 RepID=UPI0026E438D8|nr:hypothetical protein [Arenibacter palladensis]MDO6602000.1 hypothetical protein [Arenibacter palladensis]